jgi:hypothetical protein
MTDGANGSVVLFQHEESSDAISIETDGSFATLKFQDLFYQDSSTRTSNVGADTSLKKCFDVIATDLLKVKYSTLKSADGCSNYGIIR